MLPLTRDIRNALALQADPIRAGEMQAYMKSEMPFYGVPAPAVKKICSTAFRQHRLDDQKAWHKAMLDLWRSSTHREQRYAAENLAAVARYRRFQTPGTLPVYREMITDGAWWDLVDGVVNRLGELLLDHPEPTLKRMHQWKTVRNMWQRRASILCQLKLKLKTNEDLLFSAIEANMHDPEFFIRKAIGWALREYAKTSPDKVTRFVNRHQTSLSPLSRREALRILLKDGIIDSIP